MIIMMIGFILSYDGLVMGFWRLYNLSEGYPHGMFQTVCYRDSS